MLARDILSGLFRLFYPKICAVCSRDLKRGEEALCIPCLYKIPLTHFWEDTDNPVAKIFWGRVSINNACAYFYFTKGSKYRPILHKLKYQGQQEVGNYLGLQFGSALAGAECYQSVDVVIPVPLHPRKIRARGYNQSDCIGRGIAKGLGSEFRSDCLSRVLYTDTQTKKSREERIDNVSRAFEVKNSEFLQGKHVLLVDDVVTTGATLEACAQKLLEVKGCNVSVVALAYASN